MAALSGRAYLLFLGVLRIPYIILVQSSVSSPSVCITGCFSLGFVVVTKHTKKDVSVGHANKAALPPNIGAAWTSRFPIWLGWLRLR